MNTQKIASLNVGDLILHLRSELEKAERTWVDGNFNSTHAHLFNISQMGNWAAEKVHKAKVEKELQEISNKMAEEIKSTVNPAKTLKPIWATTIKPTSKPVDVIGKTVEEITPSWLNKPYSRIKPVVKIVDSYPKDISWQKVISSHISAVKYEYSTKTLMVQFQDNKIYKYENIPGALYVGLIAAPSTGKYFHRNIRQRFSGSRVS